MIIGIDETGDFDPNSTDKQFFVAVAVDQNADKHLVKAKQFREWESLIPERNRDKKSGEVKGRNLTPEQIHDFFFEVLIKPPRSYFTIIEFDPADNPKGLINKHKTWNLGQMKNAMLQREKNGQPNWARRYKELIAWYGKSNYQRVVKIESLQNLYCYSLQQALFYSQIIFLLDNEDHSNFNLKFKIDKDFVRSNLLRNFWDIHLFKFWEVFTRENKTVRVNDDPRLLQALNKYFKVEGDSLELQEPFYENTQFVDSKEHFEVRLADIFGNSLHRIKNKGQCKEVWSMIFQIVALERRVPLYIKASFKKVEPAVNDELT